MNEGKICFFTDLYAWQEGHKLVLMIYDVTKIFPKEESYGLTNQLRRAAVSITSNIAEGFTRMSYREKSNFYSMSNSSLTEVQNQLIISKDIAYLSEEKFEEIYNQTIIVHKLLNALIKKSKIIHNS